MPYSKGRSCRPRKVWGAATAWGVAAASRRRRRLRHRYSAREEYVRTENAANNQTKSGPFLGTRTWEPDKKTANQSQAVCTKEIQDTEKRPKGHEQCKKRKRLIGLSMASSKSNGKKGGLSEKRVERRVTTRECRDNGIQGEPRKEALSVVVRVVGGPKRPAGSACGKKKKKYPLNEENRRKAPLVDGEVQRESSHAIREGGDSETRSKATTVRHKPCDNRFS